MLKKTYQKIIATLVLVYALIGFILIPLVLESKVPDIASQYSDGNLSVGAIHFNPFIFKLSVEKLLIKNPHNKEAIKFKEFIVNFEAYSLFLGKIHFKNIELINPEVTINRLKDGSFDFGWLVKIDENASTKVVDEDNVSSPLPAIRIDRLRIVDGGVGYNDHSRVKPFAIHMGKLGLTLHNIDTSDMENSADTLRFYTRLSDGGFLDIKSEILAVEPFAIKGKVNFESGKLFTEWRYLQEDMKLEVADGRAHLDLDFGFDAALPKETYIDKLKFEVDHLRIKPKDSYKDVLRVGSLVFKSKRIEPMKQHVQLESLEIRNVALYAKRYKDLSLNWEHFFSSKTTEETAKAETPLESNETKSVWDVNLEHFGLYQFEAHFSDEGVRPNTKFDINDMNLSVSNISSKPKTAMRYDFAIKINQEMLCNSHGDVAHSPLSVDGNVACEKIQMPWFDTYITDAAKKSLKKYDIKLSKGTLSLGTEFMIEEDKEAIGIKLEHAYTHLDNFLLLQRSSKRSLYRFKHFGVDEVSVDTLEKSVHIGSLDYNKMWLYAERLKSGEINWNHIVVPKTAKKAIALKKSSTEKDKAWRMKLKTLVMREGKVVFKDSTLTTPLTHILDKMYLKINDIDSAPHTRLSYYTSLRVNKKGKMKAQGKLRLTPLQNRGKLEIDKLDLSDINPYLEPTLYTNLKSGELSLKSTLLYDPSETKADGVVQGSINISDLIVEDAHDDTVLLAFSSFDIAPFRFELAPNSLFVNEVKITGMYANAHIDQNRTMNFSQLLKQSDANLSETNSTVVENNTTTSESMPLRIVKLTIENGNADFADDSLPIPFNTHIHDLNGFVYGISSLQEETSYVKLAGIIDQYGSAKISGSLNSAKPHEYTDIDVLFRNINLQNMSGYSGKFAGRKIDNGKLFLDLKYEIVQSQMLGENSIIIKQMEFGDDVESEDAVSLPLDLAIALLEDGDGVIDIDMPVEGDLENPDFKYGRVVWQVFSNLIVKAVSSPFKFLMGDDAEDMQFIQFEPGANTLLPPEVEKLDNLSKALSKRPKLALAVNGTFDKVADTYAIQIEKLTLLALDGNKKGEGESMTQDRLEELYEELLGSEALDALEKRLETAYPDDDARVAREYQSSLIHDLATAQDVSPQELEKLGESRALAISNYLTLNRGVEAQRIVIETAIQSENEATTYVDTKLDLVVSEE